MRRNRGDFLLGRGLGDPSAIDPKLNLGFSDNEPDRVLATICNHLFRVQMIWFAAGHED